MPVSADTHKFHKKTSASLRLELSIVSYLPWVLGPELGSLRKTTDPPNH